MYWVNYTNIYFHSMGSVKTTVCYGCFYIPLTQVRALGGMKQESPSPDPSPLHPLHPEHQQSEYISLYSHWRQSRGFFNQCDPTALYYSPFCKSQSYQFSSVQLLSRVRLCTHGLQHAKSPYPSPTPGFYLNSCPLSRWRHPTTIRVFSNESVLCIRWPKYGSFSFNNSPSNAYSGLISFRMDWLDLLAVEGTLKSLLQHHSSKASCTDHVAIMHWSHGSHAVIPWLIMHWSRD